jgi:hypothetical protein
MTVVTSRDTRYRRGSCDDLSFGVRVEGRGVRQADGTVGASSIEFQKDKDDDEDDEDDDD